MANKSEEKKILEKKFEEFNKTPMSQRKADIKIQEISEYADKVGLGEYFRELVIKQLSSIK